METNETNKKIGDLRNIMFKAMDSLLAIDDNNTLEYKNKMIIEKAKAIADLGKVVVESAKVEVDYIRAIQNLPLNMQNDKILSGFIEKSK
jgi:hypothetical protein